MVIGVLLMIAMLFIFITIILWIFLPWFLIGTRGHAKATAESMKETTDSFNKLIKEARLARLAKLGYIDKNEYLNKIARRNKRIKEEASKSYLSFYVIVAMIVVGIVVACVA